MVPDVSSFKSSSSSSAILATSRETEKRTWMDGIPHQGNGKTEVDGRRYYGSSKVFAKMTVSATYLILFMGSSWTLIPLVSFS